MTHCREIASSESKELKKENQITIQIWSWLNSVLKRITEDNTRETKEVNIMHRNATTLKRIIEDNSRETKFDVLQRNATG